MSEWIEELERYAKDQSNPYEKRPNFRYIYTEGDLLGDGTYIVYSPEKPNEIALDDTFTIDQLQDLVNHMKKYKS